MTELQSMCEAQQLTAPRLDGDQLGSWEATNRRPQPATADLLCRLYQTDAQGVGLAGDYRGPATATAVTAHVTTQTSMPLATRAAAVDSGVGTDGDRLERWADDARRSVDRILVAGSVSPSQLDLLDERLFWLRRQYIYLPPAPMLEMLLTELGEVQALAVDRQPASVQVRLSEMTAILATLIADALMKLGSLRQSRAWYATARTAADDSGNADLRARVRAQAAMLPYYYGPLESAVALAREARLIARNRPSPTGAFAAAAEARALARQGDAAGAELAIRHARNTFEQSGHGVADDAFAFPERRLLLYLSGAHTYLGQSRQARLVRDQAFALYPNRAGIDPALMGLEEAICLAQDHSATEACQLASATYLHVPEGHRTPILSARAQDVLEVLPASMRTARAARELGEILALPPGTM